MKLHIRSAVKPDGGQSTVEFALVLPVVLLLILGMLQVGVLVRDQIMVLGAAREGVREAIVTPDQAAIASAAGDAAPGLTLDVQVSRGSKRGDAAKVNVSAPPAKLPLVGRIVDGITLKASARMRMEKSDSAAP